MTRTRIECRAGGVGVRERARAHVCGGGLPYTLIFCDIRVLHYTLVTLQYYR